MVIELTRKKAFILLSLLIVLIAVPLTVYLSQRQQDPRTRAAEEVPDTTVVATFDGEGITKGEVREVALEQYDDPAQINSQALKDALGILVERKILDKEGLDSQPVEVSQAEEEGFQETDAYYEVLKEKIILSQVKSREALTIDFWSPTNAASVDLTAEEKTQTAKELSDGIPALREAETSLRAGGDILKVAGDLLTKYPSLQNVWALNGYILGSLENDERETILKPKLFEYGDSPLDLSVREELFAMEVGDVRMVSGTETNKGGVVFKLISKGDDSGAGSYEEWLQGKKEDSFVDLNLL